MCIRLGKIVKNNGKRIAPELKSLEYLQMQIKTVFEMYCKVYGKCIELEKNKEKMVKPILYVKKNKYTSKISI